MVDTYNQSCCCAEKPFHRASLSASFIFIFAYCTVKLSSKWLSLLQVQKQQYVMEQIEVEISETVMEEFDEEIEEIVLEDTTVPVVVCSKLDCS